jgi:GAF domain-containing protein
MEKPIEQPGAEEQVWRDVLAQLREAINPPICGLLLMQRDQGHLWVDIAGQPSGDGARQLQAMILIALVGLTDLDLQPDQIVVELTSEDAVDSTEALAYLAHNDVKKLFTTLRFIASSQEARSLNVPALAAALQESTMIRNALAPFIGFRLINGQGIMLYRYPEAEEFSGFVGKNYSFRRYFQQAASGHTYVSAAFRSDFNKHVAVVSVPIVGDAGAAVGVLAGALDLEGVKSFLSVPIVHQGRILGLIAIASPEEEAFGQEKLGVLAALAEQVSKREA